MCVNIIIPAQCLEVYSNAIGVANNNCCISNGGHVGWLKNVLITILSMSWNKISVDSYLSTIVYMMQNMIPLAYWQVSQHPVTCASSHASSHASSQVGAVSTKGIDSPPFTRKHTSG